MSPRLLKIGTDTLYELQSMVSLLIHQVQYSDVAR